jgi:hypothetical protein
VAIGPSLKDSGLHSWSFIAVGSICASPINQIRLDGTARKPEKVTITSEGETGKIIP